ncbi:hypothetical protein ACI3QN_06800 [Propionibacterium freudenreichii]|uniref:hypothetical protein n=1 Tax=Propionibacterium freudenreichii TaxID=1744 RepID=UPI00385555AD
MRVMPFRVASDASITLSKPTLSFGETVVEAGDDVTGWDYLTPVTITGQFAVDPEELHRSTDLNDFEPVRVVMQVNCVSTGWRSYAVMPIPTVPPFSGQLILDIPANTVADALEVHYGIVLVADITADPHSTAPHMKGSRVFTDHRTHRFMLEGSQSGFPTEAFDFNTTSLPPQAPWHLQFNSSSLESPYRASVRLFINSSHPVGREFLNGPIPRRSRSVLYCDVLSQMLAAVALRASDELPAAFEEGTTGAVLNGLCERHLGQNLSSTIAALRGEQPTRVFTELKATLSFPEPTK